MTSRGTGTFARPCLKSEIGSLATLDGFSLDEAVEMARVKSDHAGDGQSFLGGAFASVEPSLENLFPQAQIPFHLCYDRSIPVRS